MKLLFCVFVVSSVTWTVRGDLYFYSPNAAYPGQCYSGETGVLDYGETKYFNNCRRAFCFDTGTIQMETCDGVVAACGAAPEGLSKPYPDCCLKPVPC